MPEMWEQEGLSRTRSDLCGDFDEELKVPDPTTAGRRRLLVANIAAESEHVRFWGVKRTSLIRALVTKSRHFRR